MTYLGTVSELWRYPVKSMGGECLDACTIGPLGISGDRGWAVRDERANEMRGAKKLPGLLQCRARYLEEPAEAVIPAAEITLPDGLSVRSDAADAGDRLSALLGRPVTLWPRQPATALEHYRRGIPDHADMIEELRAIFGRLETEPLPELSVFPRELFEYVSPLGTYFDAFPIHLLTTASLRALAACTSSAQVDVRRFRPNLLIDTAPGIDGFVESDWCGKTIRIGSVELQVEMPAPRCVMVTLPQGPLDKQPAILRSIVRDANQSLGVYARVVAFGRVRVGDKTELHAEK